MKVFLVLMGWILWTTGAYAHEGHDHGAKGLQPSQGGVIHKGTKLNLEVVQESGELRLFPLDTNAKPLKATDLKISGTYELPRGKAEPLALNAQKDHFSATVDAKGAHRYAVNLKVDYKGQSESFSFQVEPEE